jgi:hypothetical protein
LARAWIGLVNIQKAIENGPFIVDLPSYKMVDLSIVMLVYQRVMLILLNIYNV